MWAHTVIIERGIAEIAFPEVLYDRRFATLEGGTLVLVPATAMTGDVVCWLRPDLTTPFVLREKAELPAVSENTIKDFDGPSLRDSEPAYSNYTFVGECHIDTPIYSPVQKSTLSTPPKPHSIQDDYSGMNPGFSNHHTLETFLIS
ncbi:hypothetical protein EAF00_011815 [Botryotinia globosa]|nr:hypothetical protein EAF00_011815 [Botryotinia globosa]